MLPETSEPVEFATVTFRSPLAPRWWQLRYRLRMWRWNRRTEREYNALPPETRAAADVMQRRIDHGIFFGKDAL